MISDKAYRAMHRLQPWRETVNIKDLLTDDDSPENCENTAKALVKRLRAAFPKPDYDLENIISDFEDVSANDKRPLALFNDILDNLYDWADANRVWLGGP